MMGLVPSGSSYISRVLERGIARLNITLRLPLQTFSDLEEAPAAVPRHPEKEEKGAQIIETWTRTDEILGDMETLTDLRV